MNHPVVKSRFWLPDLASPFQSDRLATSFEVASFFVSIVQIQIISHSESETEQLGRNFGERLPAANPGWVIGLSGTLGAGKTAFMRAVAQGCGIEPSQVVSPTFGLVIPYYGRLTILHMDAYRIESLLELDELGLDEQIDAGVHLFCEWVERIEKGLPDLDLKIDITHSGTTERSFVMDAFSSRAKLFIQELGIQIDA